MAVYFLTSSKIEQKYIKMVSLLCLKMIISNQISLIIFESKERTTRRTCCQEHGQLGLQPASYRMVFPSQIVGSCLL